jgi:hypothetical protein
MIASIALSAALHGFAADAKKPANNPAIGYVYPAGGRAGTTFRVIVAGQNIKAATGAFVSGDGIGAKLIGESPAFPNFDKDQQQEIRRRVQTRKAALAGKPAPPAPEPTPEAPVELPDHPFVQGVDEMSQADLAHFEDLFFGVGRQVQRSPQLSHLAVLEITVAPDALPGRRDFRLMTKRGLSNPLGFEVGTLPEVCFPRIPRGPQAAPPAEPLELPVTINGQLLPGQTRSLQFRGRKGSRFVARIEARSLIPYIADAVPGWFQPVIALRNNGGHEIAFDDDHLLKPDPVLFAILPADGIYTVEIRDALYRGRQDFVFRASLGDLPLVAGLFPPGGREGTPTEVRIIGSGLPHAKLILDTSPGGPGLRAACLPDTGGLEVGFATGRWPEVNAPGKGRPMDIRPPMTVNGILEGTPAQAIRFSLEPGEQITIEVVARRLGSPLDASIELLGPDGQRLAAADDANQKEGDLFLGPGLLTHHADPALTAQAKRAGTHTLIVRDIAGTGGPLHVYRVEIAPPTPRFDLVASPSAVNIGSSKRSPITVWASRRGGFVGPIQLSVSTPGFRIEPGEIPAGSDRIEAQIVRDGPFSEEPIKLELAGTAMTGEKPVTVRAHPVDDSMQAFLWRHLVPAREFLVCSALGADRPKPDKKKNKPPQKQ